MENVEVIQLEALLLSLGKKELAIEKSLVDLRNVARAAVDRGDFETSDRAWNQYEQARQSLGELRRRVTDVEVKLYSLRRQLQKR